jgi:hypothetical protein
MKNAGGGYLVWRGIEYLVNVLTLIKGPQYSVSMK